MLYYLSTWLHCSLNKSIYKIICFDKNGRKVGCFRGCVLDWHSILVVPTKTCTLNSCLSSGTLHESLGLGFL
jgi:hypothetical protein